MSFLTSAANIWILWAVAIVIFLVIEGLTVGLTAIWYAIGACIALIASLFGAKPWLQLVFFLLGAVIQLILTPHIVKKIKPEFSPTNADMIIGMTGVCIEPISANSGAVKVGGKEWTARAKNESITISEGENIVVIRIEGVKLIVDLLNT